MQTGASKKIDYLWFIFADYMGLPDFHITADQPVSKAFTALNIHTFHHALSFIRSLPYGRNAEKTNLSAVLLDGFGTCSTKHAALKQLATEHDFIDLQLVLGMFRMNAANTPAIAATLKKHGLEYIPEAHCYLKYQEERTDCTHPSAKPEDFEADLLEEHNILPEQITTYKISYHRAFLSEWLSTQKNLPVSPEQLWEIREQCIRDLTQHSQTNDL